MEKRFFTFQSVYFEFIDLKLVHVKRFRVDIPGLCQSARDSSKTAPYNKLWQIRAFTPDSSSK